MQYNNYYYNFHKDNDYEAQCTRKIAQAELPLHIRPIIRQEQIGVGLNLVIWDFKKERALFKMKMHNISSSENYFMQALAQSSPKFLEDEKKEQYC